MGFHYPQQGRRASRSERRTGRWLVDFRRRHLAGNPLCVHCQERGRIRLATQLDHIKSLEQGGPDFPEDPSNAQGLCDECHDVKTRVDMGYKATYSGDADGMPIEADHPWNRGGR